MAKLLFRTAGLVAVAALFILAAHPASCQVDLGVDDCDCIGDQCNYAPHCIRIQTVEESQNIEQQRYYPEHQGCECVGENCHPDRDCTIHARNWADGARDAVRNSLTNSVPNAFNQFMSLWYDDDSTSQQIAQLGPRVYTTEQEMVICKTYYPTAGVSEWTPSQSSIMIPDEMDLTSLTVEANVTHSRIGALKIELEAKSGKTEPRKAILKPRGWGGSGENMLNTVFDDSATQNFPMAEEAPFSGSFRPKGKLQRFIRGSGYKAARGGSKGTWTLRLFDMGRNAENRTPLINNWKINACGKVDLSREKAPVLSQDIMEATEARMPVQLACPGAKLTAEGQCPLSALDVVQSMLDGTYNSTYGSPIKMENAIVEAQGSEELTDEIARAQGVPVIPGYEYLTPWRQAYDDYVERFNAWADTLPKLSNYLSTLPPATWEVMIGFVYANWIYVTMRCIRDGNCGTIENNIPQTIIIG